MSECVSLLTHFNGGLFLRPSNMMKLRVVLPSGPHLMQAQSL